MASASCPNCSVRVDCEWVLVDDHETLVFSTHDTAGTICAQSGEPVIEDGEEVRREPVGAGGEQDAPASDEPPSGEREDAPQPAAPPHDYDVDTIEVNNTDAPLLVIISLAPDADAQAGASASMLINDLVGDFAARWPERLIRGTILGHGATLDMLTPTDLDQMGLVMVEEAKAPGAAQKILAHALMKHPNRPTTKARAEAWDLAVESLLDYNPDGAPNE